MNLFWKKNIEKIEQRGYTYTPNFLSRVLSFGSGNVYSQDSNLKLSALYRAVNLISDSISSMPLLAYQWRGDWKYLNDTDINLYNILNMQPNDIMGSCTFWKLMTNQMLLTGNAYAYIDRDVKGINQLIILNPYQVLPMVVDGKKVFKYLDQTLDNSQVIHLMNYTNDGIVGQSTLTYAANTLALTVNSDKHSANFFEGGGAMSGILSPKEGVNLTPNKAKEAKEAFINATSSAAVNGRTNGVIMLDAGLSYQPISISPKDSQLIESRSFQISEIARFFGVAPSLLYADAGKYAVVEQQQLDYVTNTLLPIMEKIENEFTRKIFLKSEWNLNELRFDSSNLVRSDLTSQADFITKMINNGTMTPNEGRQRINAPCPLKGGNEAFIQVNLTPLSNPITSSAPIDNKLKNNIDNNGK